MYNCEEQDKIDSIYFLPSCSSHLITNYLLFSNVPEYTRVVITSMNSPPIPDNSSAFDIVDALRHCPEHVCILSLSTSYPSSPISLLCMSLCMCFSLLLLLHLRAVFTFDCYIPLSHIAYYMHRCAHCLRCIL